MDTDITTPSPVTPEFTTPRRRTFGPLTPSPSPGYFIASPTTPEPFTSAPRTPGRDIPSHSTPGRATSGSATPAGSLTSSPDAIPGFSTPRRRRTSGPFTPSPVPSYSVFIVFKIGREIFFNRIYHRPL